MLKNLAERNIPTARELTPRVQWPESFGTRVADLASAATDAGRPVTLEVHLLGVPQVKRDGVALPGARGNKAWALLAYLIRARAPVSRRQVADLLFGDAEDPLATLRWNLTELRRLLGPDALRGDLLQLSTGFASYVDVSSISADGWPEALQAPGLGRELLEGMSFASSPAFEVWLATERRHLQAASEAVLREAALARLAAGDAAGAADLAARLVRLNSLDENYQALLVRALAASGDGIAAARQAAAGRELFRRELGVELGPTLDAAERVLTDSPVARPLTGRAAAVAQIEAGEAAIGAGALEAGLQCLRRAIVDSDEVGDASLRTQSRVSLGGALIRAARGRDEEGATALHEALVIGEEGELPCSSACRELGYVEFLRGRYDRAMTWLDRATQVAEGDTLEVARVSTIRGAILTDTAYYGLAAAALGGAGMMFSGSKDTRHLAYTFSMHGRSLLLHGDIDAAAMLLDRSVELAKQSATSLLPWPMALRAEVDLARDDVASAKDRFEHAFALGCQIGDPCWEGMAARGLGLIAYRRGSEQQAVQLLADAVERCERLPDAYLWVKAYALESLCSVAVPRYLPQAASWVEELQKLAARSGMRELIVRAYLHRAALGHEGSAAAARALAQQIDNPRLHELAGMPEQKA